MRNGRRAARRTEETLYGKGPRSRQAPWHDGPFRRTTGGVQGVVIVEHHPERRDRLRARLDHALHGVVVSELADVAGAIFDDIGFIAVVNGLHGRQRDAGFRPQAGEDDLLAAALRDSGDEVLVVPGIHRRPLDRRLVREDGLDLGPHVPAETPGFHGAEHHGDAEDPGGLRQRHVVVDDRLAVEVGDAEEHLGLEIDQREDAVVGGQQPFFAPLRASLFL
jgi:hypothetical protein